VNVNLKSQADDIRALTTLQQSYRVRNEYAMMNVAKATKQL